MTKKKSSEVLEQPEAVLAAAVEQADAAQAESPAGSVFDFTGQSESFDAETKSVYYRLRRVALQANDESRLPDGKTYTEAAVIEILGADYSNGLVVDKKCCG
jgi:hypothetical protein